jgi:hypothetical protein
MARGDARVAVRGEFSMKAPSVAPGAPLFATTVRTKPALEAPVKGDTHRTVVAATLLTKTLPKESTASH